MDLLPEIPDRFEHRRTCRQRFLDEVYGLDVSPDLISAVTDEVLDDVAEWQNRALEPPPYDKL